MSLTAYKQKRDFRKSSEPPPLIRHRRKPGIFVVHKHAARQLHYDLRLEINGVLKSWAVPKGPTMKAGEKRLAVQVEDHPIEYGKFCGEIPEGNYGAGIVEIWDSGTYHPVEDLKGSEADKMLINQYENGNLKFILNGKHLKGEFTLLRMKRQEKKWLLIKKPDQFSEKEYSIEKLKSVKSYIKNEVPWSNKKNNVQSIKPLEKIEHAWKDLQEPMLAKLVSEIKDNADWLYEIKFDGYRILTKISDEAKEVEMISRNGNSFNKQFASLAEELSKVKAELILDGEVVIENNEGISDFQLLQNYLTTQKGTLKYYVFDILFINGFRVSNLTLLQRKELLNTFFQNYKFKNIVKTEFVVQKGEDLFKRLSKKGFEGIVAKDMESRYLPGKRSDSWIKVKSNMNQEALICGYTPPQKSRQYLGSLILGVYDQGTLTYIGNCGTGFSEASLKELHTKFRKLITKKSPFKNNPEILETKDKVIWLKPKMICQVKFQEWTQEGRMRIPVFMGVRLDKKPETVTRERADGKNKEETLRSTDEMILIANEKKIRCTHFDKIYFPEDKITKGDVINYYRSISHYILPYLKNRPLSLNRHPNGIYGPSFFQKDMNTEQLPEWLKTTRIYSKSGNKYIHYLICNDEATLIYVANLGSIEINPWHSVSTSIHKPDYIIIDLDPGDVPFNKVVDTALVIKEICDELKIECYCKTSGAKGLHIYIPLAAKYNYQEAKPFAKMLAQLTYTHYPEVTTIERPLEKRKNKIYLDFLQNHMGQTIAAAYSVRPRPHATVSAPLLWNEVNHHLSPERFTIRNIQYRLKTMGDLWRGVLGRGIDLNQAIAKIARIN